MSDWPDLGRRLDSIMATMMHREHSDLHGGEFTGEALRRLWDQVAHGYVTLEEHGRVVDASRSVDRANGITAQVQLASERAKYAETMRESARAFAAMIRHRAARIPSRYRREGALQAAGWLDPQEGSAPDGAQTDGR